MASLDEFRQQNPAYKDVPDDKLADGLYNKFYAGKIDRDIFNQKIGLGNTTPPDMQQKPGFVEGAKRGMEQTGLGIIDLANKGAKAVGYDTGYGGAIADRARQLEAQGKGTGVAGTLGEIAGNPLTYAGGMGVGGALMKAGTMGARVLGGMGAGAAAGAVSGALTPSTDAKSGLGQKAEDAAVGGVTGAAIGGALPVATAGATGLAKKVLGNIAPDIAQHLSFDKITSQDSPFTRALKTLGYDLAKSPPNADAIQSGVAGAMDKATDSAASFGRAFRPTEQSPTQVGQSLYKNKAAQTAKKNNLYDEALSGAAEADATKASNYGEIENINGQITKELKTNTAKSADELKTQNLESQNEINKLRKEIDDLEREQTAGEDIGELGQKRQELKTKRIDDAKSLLVQKEKVLENSRAEEAHARDMENLPLRGGLPRKISTGQDLIRVLQVLNRRANNSNMSNLERETLDSQRAAVRSALDELSEGKDWGKTYKAADTEVQRIDELYNTPGGALKSLGLTDDLFNSMRRAKTPELKAAAEANIVQKLDGIADKITEKGQVDALKQAMTGNGLPRSAYEGVMSKTVKVQLEKAKLDPAKMTEARELVDHILKDGVGVKSQKVFGQLDAAQTIAKELADPKIKLQMTSEKYREKEGAFKRLLDLAIGSAQILLLVGIKHGLARFGRALGPTDSAEARALLKLRSANIQSATKGGAAQGLGALTTIPGEQIGAYIGNNK